MDLVTGLNATNALLSLALNGLVAAQKYNAVIADAHAAGQTEVPDEVLARIKADSHANLTQTLAVLGLDPTGAPLTGQPQIEPVPPQTPPTSP